MESTSVTLEKSLGTTSQCSRKRHYIAKGLALQLVQRKVEHSSQDIDDLIQEVFTRIWGSAQQLTFETETKLMAYVATVITNVAHDFAAKKSRQSQRERVSLDAPLSELGEGNTTWGDTLPDVRSQATLDAVAEADSFPKALARLKEIYGERLYKVFVFVHIECKGTIKNFLENEASDERFCLKTYATLRQQMSRASARLRKDPIFLEAIARQFFTVREQ